MFNKLFKGAATGVLMSMALTAVTPAMADVVITNEPAQNDANAAYSLLLLVFTGAFITTTVSEARHHYDTSKAQSLIDQAYAGAGEKLDLLSAATKQPVETVADKIVALDKAGKLDASKPEQMALVVASSLK